MVGREAITLLELIETVRKKGCGIGHGKILAGVDTCLVHLNIVEKIAKPNDYAQDAGAKIALIKKLIKEALVKIEIE